MGGAFGKKESIMPGTAQNPIRRDPLAGGSLVGGAFGEKESIMPGSAQNESKKMRGCCRFCSGLFLTDTAFLKLISAALVLDRTLYGRSERSTIGIYTSACPYRVQSVGRLK